MTIAEKTLNVVKVYLDHRDVAGMNDLEDLNELYLQVLRDLAQKIDMTLNPLEERASDKLSLLLKRARENNWMSDELISLKNVRRGKKESLDFLFSVAQSARLLKEFESLGAIKKCEAPNCDKYFFAGDRGFEQKFCSVACKQRDYRARLKNVS